jgi:tellurite resistance protein
MKTKVEVGAFAAAADGQGSSEELQAVIATVRAGGELTDVERLRLIAYAVTLFRSPPRRQRFLKRLSEVPQEQREAIAQAAAVVVAGTGAGPDPKSVAFVERVNKSLGLDPARAHADLHRAAAAAMDQPVPMSTEVRTPGIRLPKERTAVEPPGAVAATPVAAAPADTLGIRIDLRRLEAVKRDTDAVRKTLSGIFAEDEAEAAPPPPQPHVAASGLAGLDAGHAELVIYLAGRGEVERADFERKAKSLKLLPDGAIERINDWSFDRFDGPLLEDGEQIAIQADMRSRVAELTEQVRVQ